MGAPARVHVQPRGSYSNPTGPPGPLQRRHWNPEERSACLRSGELDAWARSPLWRLLSRCHSLGCAWHPAGLPKESLPRVAELGTRREGLVTGRKLGTSTLGPQGPHPGTTLAWKGGGGERGARPGPACEHWWCHRRDWLAFQAWRPSSVLATPPSAARSAGVPERPAGWGSAAAQRCVLWTPPLPKARGPDPAPCPERAKKPSAAAPAAARLCINVGRQPDQRRGLEGRGQG